MNVAVQPVLPMPGIPDKAVIEKLRRGMAGCGSCLGVGGLGRQDEDDPSEWVSSGGYSGGDWLKDVTRGTMTILSSVFTPPAYKQVGPSGSTEIRMQPSVIYPPTASERRVGTGGGTLSNTTLLLIMAGLFMFLQLRNR